MRKLLLGIAILALAACGGRSTLPGSPSFAPASVTIPLQITVATTPSSTITGISVVATGFDLGTTVSSGGPCTSAGCSFNASVPDDDDIIKIALTNAQGAIVLSGSIDIDSDEASDDPPKLVFGGTPASALLSVQPAELVQGESGTSTLVADAEDAQGRELIGSVPFPSPITVTSSDSSGATHLSSSSIADPNATLTVTYNGASFAGAGVTFTGTSGALSIAPVLLSISMLPHRGVSGVESDDEPDSAEVLASVPDAPLVPPTTLGRVRTLAASSVDLSPNFPPVANQSLTPPCPAGSTTCSGNCAVFSAVYGIRTYMAKMANAGWPSLPGTGAWGENDNAVFSPTFTYNQQAVNGGVDDGTALTRVATSLRDVGAVTLAAVPWNPADPATSYVATYGTQAAANKITTYYDIPIGPNNITQIKAYLAAGFPIYMAVDVDGFGTMQAGGVWNGPYDGTKPGGHAMVIVGYDDNLAYTGGTGAFKVLNSWGTDWGNSGYFWLTYNWWSNGVASPESLVLQ